MHIALCGSLLSVMRDGRRIQQYPIQTYRYPQFHRDLPAKIRKQTKQANTPLVRSQAQTVTLNAYTILTFPTFGVGQSHSGETGGGLRRSKPQVPEVG